MTTFKINKEMMKFVWYTESHILIVYSLNKLVLIIKNNLEQLSRTDGEV